eukprot:c24749_g1_i2 orf=354-842(-)
MRGGRCICGSIQAFGIKAALFCEKISSVAVSTSTTCSRIHFNQGFSPFSTVLGANLCRYGESKIVTGVRPFICTMPMRLDEGWNQIQFNLSDFTRRAYGTNYIETLRVQVHANCRLRRIYFCDRLYPEEEVPAEFKLFLPIQETRTYVSRDPALANGVGNQM